MRIYFNTPCKEPIIVINELEMWYKPVIIYLMNLKNMNIIFKQF